MAFSVNSELVAVHWLRSLALGPQVATSVPERSATFEADGFVRVLAVGGAPHVYTGRQASMIQVDSFAYREGSRSVPWGRAATMLADVKAVVEGGAQVQGTVVTPSSFLNARLMGVATNSDPQRVVDEGGMARYSMLLQLWWVPIPEEG